MLHLLWAIASIFVKKVDQKEESSMTTEEAEIVDLYDYPSTKITDIVIYPLRSVRGIHVEKAKLTPTGFEFDRVWLCIEKCKEDGSEWRWQNINSAKNLGNTSWRFEDGLYIIFAHPNWTEELKIELNAELKTRKIYKCKNYDGHIIEGYYEGEEAEKWFTQALGKHVALIRSFTNPPLGLSGTDEKYIEKYQKYSMNPGHSSGPLHFVTEKSVEDLRSRVDDPDIEITPAQFRPNLVLKGNIAYEEDNMRELPYSTLSNPPKTTDTCPNSWGGLDNGDFLFF